MQALPPEVFETPDKLRNALGLPLAFLLGIGACLAAQHGTWETMGLFTFVASAAGLCWCLFSRFSRSRKLPLALTTAALRSSPFPFPNGWYRVCVSEELKEGAVFSARVAGRDIVVFRSRGGGGKGKGRGEATALRAHCPHLGAHLGRGGRVNADGCLECPFHGWCFGGDGKPERAAYAPRLPAGTVEAGRTLVYPCLERNGYICVWIHADEEAQAKPEWQPEAFTRFDSCRYHGHAEHYVSCHTQLIPENGADTAHFNAVHGPFLLPWLSWLIRHRWEAVWTPGQGDMSHTASVVITSNFLLCGKRWLPDRLGLRVTTQVTQLGPGLVHIVFHLPVIGRVFVVESVTPVAPMLQRVLHSVHADRWVPRWLAKALLWSSVTQFERDIPIWEALRHTAKPILLKEDGPVLRFRRWYKQFYSQRADDW